MSIKDIPEKIKPFWANTVIPLISKVKSSLNIKEDLFIVFSIILIGLAGFGLGKLSALEKGREPVEIRQADFNSTTTSGSRIPAEVLDVGNQSAAAMIASESAKGLLVASKSGKKYHFPWCAGASQIAEKNKIWFDSYEEAKKAGYTPAANCPSLK